MKNKRTFDLSNLQHVLTYDCNCGQDKFLLLVSAY